MQASWVSYLKSGSTARRQSTSTPQLRLEMTAMTLPASGAALRASPRLRSFKLADLHWSGQREEGIDCGGFSPPAGSVEVSGVDCPANPAAVCCASSIGCSVCDGAVGCWRSPSELCCKIGFASGDGFDDPT